MTGYKLISNLTKHLSANCPESGIKFYTYNANTNFELPSIVIGYANEQCSFSGNTGHYTVDGFVVVNVNGYEDRSRVLTLKLTNWLTSYFTDTDSLTGINKPKTGTDTRPLTGFHCNALILKGISEEINDGTTQVSFDFNAYCVPKDY